MSSESKKVEGSKSGEGGSSKGVVESAGKLEAGFLEEDDEFEEFPVEEWHREEGDAADDPHVWDDAWDDDQHQDDFAKQLKHQLANIPPKA